MSAFSGPAHLNAAAGFECRVRRIPNQVNQQLLQLVGVGRNHHLRTFRYVDLHTRLKFHRPADPFRDVYRQQLRLWQTRKLRVRGHEPPKRLGARTNDAQTLPQIIQNGSRRFTLQLRRLGGVQQSALQTLSDRLNRRQRIVQFMSQHANKPLPRFALFVAKRAAQIR